MAPGCSACERRKLTGSRDRPRRSVGRLDSGAGSRRHHRRCRGSPTSDACPHRDGRSSAWPLLLVGLAALALELLEEVALARLAGTAVGVVRPRRERRGDAASALAPAVEAGGDDRDHDLVAEPLVEARPEDDVRLRVGGGADLLGRLRDLEQATGWTTGDVEQDALGARDVDLEERAGDRPGGRPRRPGSRPLARPMPMSAEPASRMIVRTSAKSRLMSPGTVMMSLIPWTPWRRTSSTTRNASRMRGVLLDDVAEAVVGDRDERVDLRLELLGRLLRDQLALGRPRRRTAW